MREWHGSIFKRAGADTWSVKWLEFAGSWRVTRGFRTRADAADFLTEKRRIYRQRRRGDYSPADEHRHRPIAEHLADFGSYLVARSSTEKHRQQTSRRLEAILARMKVRTLDDATLTAAVKALGLMAGEGAADKTRDDYRAVLVQFGRWLDADQRVEKNPFALLPRLYDPTSREMHRQALAWEQVRDLAAAAVQRVLQRSPARTREKNLTIARRRALIITAAGLTGMRHAELAHLTWLWIDTEERSITVPAEVAKSGKTRRVPLHRGLAELLEQERRRRAVATGAPVPGSDLVLGEMVNGEPKLPRHVNERLREDAAWIKIPAVDEQGHVLDLHALRGSLGTALRLAGASMDDVGDVLGHAPASVTGRHYVQAAFERKLATIDLIPVEAAQVAGLWTPRETPNRLRLDADSCGPERQELTG